MTRGRSPPSNLVYLYLAKGPRGVGRRWEAGPGRVGFLRILCFSSKTTNFSLRRGPRAVSHTRLRRPWGRIELPELPTGAFGGSKYPKSGLNLGQCSVPGGRFRGFLAFGTNWRTKREPQLTKTEIQTKTSQHVVSSGRAAPFSLDPKLPNGFNVPGRRAPLPRGRKRLPHESAVRPGGARSAP